MLLLFSGVVWTRFFWGRPRSKILPSSVQSVVSSYNCYCGVRDWLAIAFLTYPRFSLEFRLSGRGGVIPNTVRPITKVIYGPHNQTTSFSYYFQHRFFTKPLCMHSGGLGLGRLKGPVVLQPFGQQGKTVWMSFNPFNWSLRAKGMVKLHLLKYFASYIAKEAVLIERECSHDFYNNAPKTICSEVQTHDLPFTILSLTNLSTKPLYLPQLNYEKYCRGVCRK